MEAEMREQPALLAKGARTYHATLSEAFAGRSFDMVLLVARGSSDHAALYARYLIEIHLGIPASLAAPSVLTRYGSSVRYTNALAVGISQSGAATDVAELLAEQRRAGHATLGITNTPNSKITHAAEHALLLDAGPERSVAATKTYTTSLLAVHELVRALGGGLEPPEGHLPDSTWIETAREAAERGLGPLLRSHILFSLARGYRFGTASETALKLMECALLPCKSYSLADFQHGPKALAGPGAAAIVFGEPVDDLREQGCWTICAPPAPDTPIQPIWDIVFGQWLALLAARARGLDPDDPRFIEKVTDTR